MSTSSTLRGGNAPGAAAARITDFETRFQSEQRTRLVWNGIYGVLFAAALVASAMVSGFSLPKLMSGLPNAWTYIYGTFPQLAVETLGADLREWYWGLSYWLRLLVETALMGFVGTTLGGFVGFVLSFPASRNLVQSKAIYFVARRLLEFLRTVPTLVFALIFVFAFGLGPLAGVVAIAVHTAGSMGKLFAEVNENVDMRPIEGVRAAGGNWPMIVRLGVIPQALPNYASYLLLRLEINVRSASALGVVGAGGIGQELYLAIRQFAYPDISAIMLLLIITVSIIDISCETVRHRLIGQDFAKGH